MIDDTNDFSGFNEFKKIRREKRRNSLYNMINRLNLGNRCEFINDGTVLFDGKYTYYCQSKKAKCRNNPKYYQMRGFQHFVDVFLNRKNGRVG